MNSARPTPTIAVLGLGAMGTAIAGALAASGARVRAWNRTARTHAELGIDRSEGSPAVELVASPETAVTGADLVVVCVLDHRAARVVVEQVAPALAGRVLVNVSTGTAAEAAESAGLAVGLGVHYVTGAVMVPTPMVGTDDCFVLYAGAPDDLAALGPLTAALGGTSDLTGDDHAVPPALDLAMLDIYFAGMYAHLHATALAAAHGIDPRRFLPYGQGIVTTLGGTLESLTEAVEHRRYDAGQARLDMCAAFLEHIVATSTEAGIAPGLAGEVLDATNRALAERPPGTDWDVVAEELLPAPTTR